MNTDLKQWLAYLEQIHPSEIELGLERVNWVYLQIPQLRPRSPVIMVGGTNGKGSTVAILDSIYSAAGYRVGCYTSPHLLNFNERIRVAGQAASDEEIVAAFELIESTRGEVSLTYFEFTTLAALAVFAAHQPDLILLEVGLGGRLDAVNVVEPDISIVTSIALDHEAWLGETLDQIGQEKAGIFRSGRPAICGDFAPPNGLLREAHKKQAELQVNGQAFEYRPATSAGLPNGEFVGLQVGPVSIQKQTHYQGLPAVSLPVVSVACALQALHQLALVIPQKALVSGLKQIQIAGRFQCVGGDPVIILDVAHNPAAAQLLANNLLDPPAGSALNVAKRGRCLAVFAVLQDKAIDAIIRPLEKLIDVWFVGELDASRAIPAAQVEQQLQSLDLPVNRFESVADAYCAALQYAQQNDWIVVFGSFYTVAGVLAGLKSEDFQSTQIPNESPV